MKKILGEGKRRGRTMSIKDDEMGNQDKSVMEEGTPLTAAQGEIAANPPETAKPPARIVIRVPARHNPRLLQVIDRVNADEELYTLWQVINIRAVQRLGMSDHGPVHVQVVTNIALKLLRLLGERGVQPSMVVDHNLSFEEAEVVVVLASLLHDLGMSIHRIDHEQYSLFLARPKIGEFLDGLYDVSTRAILTSEILHAIISHRAGGRPLTLEAGVVRVADALDMAEGRTRIPFQAGQVNIHSVSALAIERVSIEEGKDTPIRISVRMNNAAGIFQVDELLKDKLQGSGLEPYIEVEASTEGEADKKLIKTLRI
jgi:metal-dependent HD superfamily phosphatase/phosphodiesterase